MESTATIVPSWIPPTPCDTLAGYTVTRVQHGLDYAQGLLDAGLITTAGSTSQTITPLTTKILFLYEAACKDTLAKLQAPAREDDLNGAKEEVYDYETSQQDNEFLTYIANPEKRQSLVVQPVLALRKYQLLCRYGEYMRSSFTEILPQAFDLDITDDPHINATHRWSVLNKAVKEEMEQVGPLAARLATEVVPSPEEASHVLNEDQLKEAPTLRAIYETTGLLHIHWFAVVQDIQTYTQHDESVRSQLYEHVEKGNDDDVAELLYRDLCDLPKIFHPEDADDEAMYSMIIRFLMSEWFDTGDDISAIRYFERKPALDELVRKVNCAAAPGDTTKKAQTARELKEHEEALQRKVAKAVADRHAEKHLIERLVIPPNDQ